MDVIETAQPRRAPEREGVSDSATELSPARRRRLPSASVGGDGHGRAIVLRLLAGIACALMAAGVKLASGRGANVIEIIFYRNAFSLPLIVGWIAMGPRSAGIAVRRPRAHVSRAVVGLAATVLNFQAISMLPLAEATVIGFAVPFFATVLSAWLLGEEVRRHRWLAILIGLVGVLVVVQPGASHVPLAGALVGVAAALGVAAVTVTLRQLGSTESATATVFWFAVTLTVVTGLSMPWLGQAHDPATWMLLLWVGLTGGAAQLLNTASLRLAPVSVLGPFDYTQLVWAAAIGWMIWDATPSPVTWIGAAVIMASGFYVVHRERPNGQSA
jgi:drug/metabolite transporter (DMT)-like permease